MGLIPTGLSIKCSCSLDSIPGPGTSTCHSCSHKNKKIKKIRKGKKEGRKGEREREDRQKAGKRGQGRDGAELLGGKRKVGSMREVMPDKCLNQINKSIFLRNHFWKEAVFPSSKVSIFIFCSFLSFSTS